MSESIERTTTGPRLIATVYAGLVVLSGVLGGLIGLILPVKKDVTVAALGPITFPVTPASMAIYGMVNVALLLGVLLLVVRYVSERYDDEEPAVE